MPSKALDGLLEGLQEVKDLETINPSPTGAIPKLPQATRALGRASVVLLSSHFERYIRNINEEICDYLNRSGVAPAHLSSDLRLLHSREPIDELGVTSWDNRASKLTSFFTSDGWLWLSGTGTLDHQRILAWMRTPKSKEVIRFYKYWQVNDVFGEITRKPETRSTLFLRINELVDKRNSIAHGDFSSQATQQDVRLYYEAVKTFCTRADRLIARRLSLLLSGSLPW